MSPDIQRSGLPLNLKILYDTEEIQRISKLAKPFPRELLPFSLPAKLDWSYLVSLVRTQDNRNTCRSHAALHCIDAIQEMAHPYTPDGSYRFFQYWLDRYAINNNPDRDNVDKKIGVCTEPSLPSDYLNYTDADIHITQFNDSTEIWGGINYANIPRPTADNNAEAYLFRCDPGPEVLLGDDGANVLKGLLVKYGPLVTGFSTDIPFGGAHAIMCVGYDDATSQFKFLNTWTDRQGKEGYYFFPYDIVQYISYIHCYTNIPSDRSNTRYAYSGRINIISTARNRLTVSAGVDGSPSQVFWNHPNNDRNRQYYDDCKNLCIDVPLPAYAASCWPPSGTNRWYFEVVNSTADVAEIRQALLARLIHDPNCQSMGEFKTEVFQMSQAAVSIPANSTSRIYIPSNQIPAAQTYQLSLKFPPGIEQPPSEQVLNVTVLVETTVGAKGGAQPTKLSKRVTVMTPLPGITLHLFEIIQNVCVNLPLDYVDTGKSAVTDSAGNCSFHISPTYTGEKNYCVAYIDNTGAVVASSNRVSVTGRPKTPIRRNF
jgi:hypothetical protein